MQRTKSDCHQLPLQSELWVTFSSAAPGGALVGTKPLLCHMGISPNNTPPHKICIGQRSLHGYLWMGWVGILKPSVSTQQRAFKGSLITSCALSLGGVSKMASWRDEHNYLSGAGRSQEPRFVAYWYRFVLLLFLPEALKWSPIHFPHFGSLNQNNNNNKKKWLANSVPVIVVWRRRKWKQLPFWSLRWGGISFGLPSVFALEKK